MTIRRVDIFCFEGWCNCLCVIEFGAVIHIFPLYQSPMPSWRLFCGFWYHHICRWWGIYSIGTLVNYFLQDCSSWHTSSRTRCYWLLYWYFVRLMKMSVKNGRDIELNAVLSLPRRVCVRLTWPKPSVTQTNDDMDFSKRTEYTYEYYTVKVPVVTLKIGAANVAQ